MRAGRLATRVSPGEAAAVGLLGCARLLPAATDQTSMLRQICQTLRIHADGARQESVNRNCLIRSRRDAPRPESGRLLRSCGGSEGPPTHSRTSASCSGDGVICISRGPSRVAQLMGHEGVSGTAAFPLHLAQPPLGEEETMKCAKLQRLHPSEASFHNDGS